MANEPKPPKINRNPKQVGSLPANSQLQPDLTGQSYPHGVFPTIRIMPPAPSGVAGNVSASISSSPTVGEIIDQLPDTSFDELTSGTNTNAFMVVSGSAVLSYAADGIVNANEIGTILVDGNVPQHSGQFLISQPGNESAMWADPMMMGAAPEGTLLALSPPMSSPPIPQQVNPLLLGGRDSSSILHGLATESDGTLKVSVTTTTVTDLAINGFTTVDPDINNSLPSAPEGYSNVLWQSDGTNISAYVLAATPPGGTSGELQYNDSGAFAGATGTAVDSFGTIAIAPTGGANPALTITSDGTNPVFKTVDSLDDAFVINMSPGAGSFSITDGPSGATTFCQAGTNTASFSANAGEDNNVFMDAYVDGGVGTASIGGTDQTTDINTFILQSTGGVGSLLLNSESGNPYILLSNLTLQPNIDGSTWTMQLPTDGGTNGYVLATDGTGITSWVAIPAAPVSSVFGRTGAVVAVSGDYAVGQVTGAASSASVTAAITTAEGFATSAVAAEATARNTAIGVETTRAETAEAAAIVSAESFATSAVAAEATARNTAIGVETTRAEAAEGLLAPEASPTFTGTAAFTNITVSGTTSFAAGSIAYAALSGTPSIPTSFAWNVEGNATGNLTLANAAYTSTFNQTSAAAWLWANTTVASAVTTNASPLLELAANYYTGSASAADTWTIQSSLVAGTNGNSSLNIAHSGSSGFTALNLPTLTNLSWNGDTFLSRSAAGTVQVGAAPFTASGTLSATKVSFYNATANDVLTLDSTTAGSGILVMTTPAATGIYPQFRIYPQSTTSNGSFGLIMTQNNVQFYAYNAMAQYCGGQAYTSALGPFVSFGSYNGIYATNTSGTQVGASFGAPLATTANLVFMPSAASSSSYVAVQVIPIINATVNGANSGGYTALKIAPSETSLGSGVNKLLDMYAGTTGTTAIYSVDNKGNHFLNSQATAPTSALTAGTAGQFMYSGTNMYVCTVTGAAGSATWSKVNLTAV